MQDPDPKPIRRSRPVEHIPTTDAERLGLLQEQYNALERLHDMWKYSAETRGREHSEARDEIRRLDVRISEQAATIDRLNREQADALTYAELQAERDRLALDLYRAETALALLRERFNAVASTRSVVIERLTAELERATRTQPKLAQGGTVSAGRIYLVGEHGPEPIEPGTWPAGPHAAPVQDA